MAALRTACPLVRIIPKDRVWGHQIQWCCPVQFVIWYEQSLVKYTNDSILGTQKLPNICFFIYIYVFSFVFLLILCKHVT